MLVCSVSQRVRRAVIGADIVEAGAALDSPGTGNVVFATLVDDPTSVIDTVNAYLGNIMLEAASAAATVNAGTIYATAIVEQAAAIATHNGAVPRVIAVDVAEAAAATATQGAVTVASTARFEGAIATGPLMPFGAPPPTVIYLNDMNPR